MSLKFRKSIKVAPGVRLNFNKKSTSVTFGGKGLHYTKSSTGKQSVSSGIPGTGLYYQRNSGGNNMNNTKVNNNSINTNNNFNNFNSNLPPVQPNGMKPSNKPSCNNPTWVFWLLLAVFPIAGIIYLWAALDKKWSGPLKAAFTALSLVWLFFWTGIIGGIITSGSQQSSNTQQPSSSEFIQEVNNQTEAPTEEQHENMSTSSPTTAATDTPTSAPTEATTEVLTKVPTEAQTQAPTKAPVIENTVATQAPTQTAKKYVLNTSTHKIHYTKCSEVKKIKSENYQEYSGDITTLINQGYTSCQRCHAR